MSDDQFDLFTERARHVLTLAQEEATRLNHNYIGPEHLLLALARDGEGIAAMVLSNLGIELIRVRSAVEFIIGRGDRMIAGEIGLTPRAKKVIKIAVDEARRLGHHDVGTEHLLLGIMREDQNVGAGVLTSFGISTEQARSQTIQVLSKLGETAAAARETLNPNTAEAERTPVEATPASAMGWGPETAIPLRRRQRWEYLVAQVRYPDPN